MIAGQHLVPRQAAAAVTDGDNVARVRPTWGGGMAVYFCECAGVTAEARAIGALVLVSVGVVFALPVRARRECVVM